MDDTQRYEEWLAKRAKEATSLAEMYERLSPVERVDFIDNLRHKLEVETGKRVRDIRYDG